MLREGRELIPTAKAFQLMTLLRGLGVEELSKAELTGEWEYKLAQMEHGKLSRDSLHGRDCRHDRAHGQEGQGIRPRHHPGDYATLQHALPQLRRRGQGKLPPLHLHRQVRHGGEGCGFSFGKTPAGRTFEVAEVEQFLRDRKIGPLDGFRSKAGWPFTAEMVIKFDEETKNYKLEFDFGDDKKGRESGELIDFWRPGIAGCLPQCGGAVFEHGKNYVCEKSVPTWSSPRPAATSRPARSSCSSRSARADAKLLATGKTDLLDKFVSACAPAAPSRPCWPGMPRPAR
jgi:DNA topoisomerase-3